MLTAEQAETSHDLLLKEFVEITSAGLSPEQVLTDSELIVEKSGLTDVRARLPKAIVLPENAEQVQFVVQVANRLKTQLWPCSRGRNWGYGAAAALDENTVLLLLERMNRILEVNEELGYVRVEPGVSYRQLNEHLKNTHSNLWPDCTDGPPDGSVIGNALDKGVGHTPYGDHFGNLCGLEAVLPNGDIIQTGGGPTQRSRTWNTYKWGTGPVLDGLFAQSNLGIVTQAGFWLMPRPQQYTSFYFDLHREEDFPSLIDAIRRLRMAGVYRSTNVLVSDLSTLFFLGETLSRGSAAVASQEMLSVCRRHGIPPWNFSGGIYGTKEQVRAYRKVISRELKHLGSIRFMSDSAVQRLKRMVRRCKRSARYGTLARALLRRFTGKSLELLEALPEIHGIMKGEPTEHFVRLAYFRNRSKQPQSDFDPGRDRCGILWFAPMVPLSGQCVGEVLEIGRHLFQQHNFDFFRSLHLHNERSTVVLMGIFYCQEDAEETTRAYELHRQLNMQLTRQGYQQYRITVSQMPDAMASTGPYLHLLERIKEALDANRVLASGRYGVW